MYRITTQYSGTKVSLGFPPSSSLTQGILQINHHVNPLAWELWAVGKQEGNVKMRLGNRRKPWMRNEGWTHRGAAHHQDGSSRDRKGVILGMYRDGMFQTTTGEQAMGAGGRAESGKGKERVNSLRRTERENKALSPTVLTLRRQP